MAVCTTTKTYHTKAHMGMIDVTEDFQSAVSEACRKHGISAGIVTGFTTGGVAALTTLEFEPGLVHHDLKEALDVFSPYRDEHGPFASAAELLNVKGYGEAALPISSPPCSRPFLRFPS